AYDGATRTMTINMDAGPDYALVEIWVSRLADGTIQWYVRGAAGTIRDTSTCADGAGTLATVANTDVVDLVGTRSGVQDGLVIDGLNRADLRSAANSWAGTGVEFRMDFGPTPVADRDRVTVLAGGGNDTITVGTGGIGLDTGGTGLVFGGTAFPAFVSLDGGYGSDTISAAGGAGFGGPAPSPVDIEGDVGADVLTGGLAGDEIDGGTGNDTITGGAGADTLIGDSQNDIIYANDGEPDALIDGGAHTDTVHYDVGIDPAPTGAEIVNP
ncbi:MAG: calcium-binding protein, partial [Gaiellaceae bacterium]